MAAVAAGAFLIKILIALETYGTNDAYVYEQFSFWTRYVGVLLYTFDPSFNHPPSMIHILHGISWMAKATGLPFPFWLRVPGILADAGNVFLVWKLMGDRVRERSTFWALLLLASAPTLILICGFHGNTDSVVMFFLMLSVYCIERERSAWAAGAAYGAALCFKVVPAIVFPVLFLNLARRPRPWRERVKFCVAASLVLLAAWSPFVFKIHGPSFHKCWDTEAFTANGDCRS